jgi:hypothetical protein
LEKDEEMEMLDTKEKEQIGKKKRKTKQTKTEMCLFCLAMVETLGNKAVFCLS